MQATAGYMHSCRWFSTLTRWSQNPVEAAEHAGSSMSSDVQIVYEVVWMVLQRNMIFALLVAAAKCIASNARHVYE